jgi:hypothetical protein
VSLRFYSTNSIWGLWESNTKGLEGEQMRMIRRFGGELVVSRRHHGRACGCIRRTVSINGIYLSGARLALIQFLRRCIVYSTP